MARITVEDGLKKIGNRFQLALAAAKRAKQIQNGSPLTIASNDNKPVVNALREIEEGKVRLATADELKVQQETQKTEALDALFEDNSSNGRDHKSEDSKPKDLEN